MNGYTGYLQSSLPSWLPHSQSGPRTTLAPWKVPFNVMRVKFCRGLTRTLQKENKGKQINLLLLFTLSKAPFQLSVLWGPSVPQLLTEKHGLSSEERMRSEQNQQNSWTGSLIPKAGPLRKVRRTLRHHSTDCRKPTSE